MANIVNGSDQQAGIGNGPPARGLNRRTIAELGVPGRPLVPPGRPDGVRRRVVPAGFFVLRTPLLPFDEILRWGDGVESAPDLRSRLAAALARPEVREALFLGSPDLAAALPLWQRDPTGGRGPGIERALARYFLRMASRPTPFALFGGVSVGTVGQRTRLVLAGREEYKRHSTLDVDILRSAAGRAVAEDEGVPYEPSSTLYRTAGELRWVERRGGSAPTHHLVAAERHPAVDAVLDRAAGGATRAELGTPLADDLVAAQALVPAVQVPATAGDPLAGLLGQLRRHAPGAEVTERMGVAAGLLAALDAGGLGADPRRYGDVAAALGDLAEGVDRARLVGVQLLKPAPAATLGAAVVDELRRGVGILHRLARRPPRPDFERFAAAFERRYGEREVPLLEALDQDLGVGYGAPAPGGQPAGPPEPAWGRREAVLLPLLAALPPGEVELALTDADVDALADGGALPLPGAFAVLATVAAGSAGDLDAGRFGVVLEAAGGPSGAWMLGRFCAADPDLLEHVRRHLAAEEAADPEAVWAEVAHLPAGKFGNVVMRPALRRHEIPYLGGSGVPGGDRIPASDLLLSRRDGRFVLRSASLGRRVVPRSTTAHDFTAAVNLPAYRFLCALQVAEVQGGLAWSWGGLAGAPFLPRVRTGRIVLARARWRVPGHEVRHLADGPDHELLARVAGWRAARRLPRLVSLEDGDRGLVVDLDNPLAVHALVDAVPASGDVVLEELFPGPEDLCCRGPEGSFVHELVVPFTAEPLAAPPAWSPAARRSLPAGSQWLDARLYVPASAGDGLVADLLVPLRDRAGPAAWHFVRGADPDHHVRIRLRGRPADLREAVAGLHDAVATGLVRAVGLDAYEQPLECFGGPCGAEAAEAVFTADSDAAAGVLGLLPAGDERADRRWRAALAGADLLLDDVGAGGPERTAALRRRRDHLAAAVGLDARLEGDLSRRFRAERADLAAWCDAVRTGAGPHAGLLRPLRERSAALADAAGRWRRLAAEGALGPAPADAAVRLVDESLARLLPPDPRLLLAVYDSLTRLHLARAGRAAAGRA
ncbi:MAG TPA: lantibiotic dehydratase [Acidimicrobiales bacterium]|nr:lantibiotic dehydratase [Acidimicrobiales bacterium]